ncbi:MAG: hypothetical protein JWM40_2092 [Frankiales bacterium]|nr:hypothetical protein [Frankiales bacterium]
MGMRRVLLLLCLILATACSSDGGAGSEPREELNPADPVALVGDWSVRADGAPTETVLILRVRPAVTDLTIKMACGTVGGSWAAEARQSLFLGQVSSGSGDCFGKSGIQSVDWLRQVTGFRTDGDHPLLVDARGATVATLTPASSTPTPRLTTSAELASSHFGEPAPLPGGATAVSGQQLVGRWVPSGGRVPVKADTEFRSDGTWVGSDGCNGHGGRYVLGREGRLLVAANGISTLVACESSPINQWVATAMRVGTIGAELVFYDRTGKELGRAVAG